jgi:hypothetical protein
VAVIVAVPTGPTDVSFPSAVTVATAGADVLKTTLWPEMGFPVVLMTVAESWSDDPAAKGPGAAGLMVMLAATIGSVPSPPHDATRTRAIPVAPRFTMWRVTIRARRPMDYPEGSLERSR